MDTIEEDRSLEAQMHSQYLMNLEERMVAIPTPVLERYVRFVEHKYDKLFFGSICLLFEDKYNFAIEELKLKKEYKQF